MPLTKLGEAFISFKIPNDTQQKTLTVSLKTYLSVGAIPMISLHSASIVDKYDFKAIFYPEFSTSNEEQHLVANVPTNLYVQILTETTSANNKH